MKLGLTTVKSLKCSVFSTDRYQIGKKVALSTLGVGKNNTTGNYNNNSLIDPSLV
jgi:hypothetical protein